MKHFFPRILVLFQVLMASACMPFQSQTPIPLDTNTPTIPPSTATATVIWFPSTPTNSPIPTHPITPTPELRPGVGDLYFQDDFSKTGEWQEIATDAGSVAQSENEITIAINSPKAYLSSLRTHPLLVDFYLEITASPSLCKGADEYGLLLRASSPRDFYRFSLTCDGRTRLDRVIQGVASSPQPWVTSGGVPPFAPSSSRLGVWALGAEMRFFVNDIYQFKVQDSSLPSGNLGIFARSAGDNALTVSFSNLVVKSLSRNK